MSVDPRIEKVPGPTKSEQRLSNAIGLLEMLSFSPDGRVPESVAREHLGCSESEFEVCLDLISSLSDRETGSRVIVYRDGGDIVSAGSAARISPLRLTPPEAAALGHVLDALNIEDETRDRLRRALLPLGWDGGEDALIATTVPYGSWYQRLSTAIVDGVRLRIAYRSHEDERPAERLVDPIDIETVGGNAYLIAWNVEKDAGRRYRLERISDVELTDDSVEDHSWDSPTLKDSMGRAPRVWIEVAPGAAIPYWTEPVTERPLEPESAGGMVVAARVHSKRWLFDHVLAAAGDLRIMDPAEVVSEFIEYARQLS